MLRLDGLSFLKLKNKTVHGLIPFSILNATSQINEAIKCYWNGRHQKSLHGKAIE